MNIKWRLEFNVEQQVFHQEYAGKGWEKLPITDDWFVIYDEIDCLDCFMFMKFIDTKNKEVKTKSFLMKCKIEFDCFFLSLKENGIKFIDIEEEKMLL
jgi:hypothetical protein